MVVILYRVCEYAPNLVRMWKAPHAHVISDRYKILRDGELVMDLLVDDENYATVVTSTWEVGFVFRKYLSRV